MMGARPTTTPDQTTPAAGRGSIHLFLVTADPIPKIAPVLAELARLPQDMRLTVLSGGPADPDETTSPGVSLLRFTGETTFDLRSRIPALAGDAEWLVLLEDHNRIDRSWLERLSQAVAAAPPDAQAVCGGVDNQTSRDRWSWANFLMVLGFHWAPGHRQASEPIFFNVAFRRSLLPADHPEVGEFEVHLLSALGKNSTAADFVIDHVQFRTFPGVFLYHWCNGRVTGAAMRRHHRDGLRHVLRHARRVCTARVRQLAESIRRHPSAAQLPSGTLARVGMLSVCHATGAVYGGLFGPGDAARHLE